MSAEQRGQLIALGALLLFALAIPVGARAARRSTGAALALGAALGAIAGALFMHKYLTCAPCAAKRAAALRALGLRLIE